MNDQKHFSTDRMNELLRDQLTVAEQTEVESHLNNCSDCRDRLERMVADPADWEKAAQHLSDLTDIRPPDWMASASTVSIELDPHRIDTDPMTEGYGSYVALPLEAPTHPEMLGRIDGFEIEKEIGRGGCGVVYKGFDRELNRPVAIKVLAPHLASNGIARKRFAREARAAAAVVHPNVVPIHSVSSEPERPYIVMALVNGRSLESQVREHGPLELKDIVRIAQQIADGLAAAHRQGLIHRDIKPANILLEQDLCRVMITDFGLARAADDAAITQTGWLAGTPHYMSPEQAKGVELDQRSDLFSLGSLIYFMSTGREPFRAEKPFAVIQKIITETPIKARQVNSDISKTLGQIIDRLLCKNPRDRFQSAEEVHRTLESYLAHLQNPLASPKPKGIRRGVAQSRSLHVSLIALAAALLLGSAGWYAFLTAGLPMGGPTTGEPTTVLNSSLPTGPLESPNSNIASTDPNSLLSDTELQEQINSLGDSLLQLELEMGSFVDDGVGMPHRREPIQPTAEELESTLQQLNPNHDINKDH